MVKKVELLAPCGSYESFLAAVNAGADAVYLGGNRYSARAYADNFSQEELVRVIHTAHLYQVKVYLTVNTLMKEEELEQLYDFIYPCYLAGLDGVIVQDMGVFSFIRRNFPDMELHASTQMTLTGVYGAAYLKKLGCSRIVPARELSLSEIRKIKETVDIEIEAFIHGAMCYCYSGQCLMSSMIGGRSGNRGRCAQPCRLPYQVHGKEGYFLSLKDMNTLEYLPELMEAGIDSFKIEGRMKKPEYVAGVVSLYRKYMDFWYEHEEGELSGGFEISEQDRKLLNSLYIRSETGDGYYHHPRGKDMLTLESPGYRETPEVFLRKLRETYCKELPPAALSFRVECRAGEPIRAQARCALPKPFRKKDGKTETLFAAAEGPVLERAGNRPATEEDVKKQMKKLGGTPFVLAECQVELGEDCFVPVKVLNELRRELLEKIYLQAGGRTGEDCRRVSAPEGAVSVSEDRETKEDTTVSEPQQTSKKACSLTLSVQKPEQFHALFPFLYDARETEENCVLLEADLLEEKPELIKPLQENHMAWGIRLPRILRDKDAAYLSWLEGFVRKQRPKILYCGTIDAFAWTKEIHFEGKIAEESSQACWNRESLAFWGRESDVLSLPPELGSREIRSLCNGAGEHLEKLEAALYGRTPLMVTANCIRLSTGSCEKKKSSDIVIKDRLGKEFPVFTNCRHCYNVIYNCLPLSLHGQLWMLKQDGISRYRLDFTTEPGKECGKIYQTFQELLSSDIRREEKGLSGVETTTGHIRRGVE